jgi:hypothetical protein
MRRGFNPKIILTAQGQLSAISTGSDFVTEHEIGSARMQAALSYADTGDSAVIENLKEGKPTVYPSTLQRKSISKFPKELTFLETGGSTPTAIFSYSRRSIDNYKVELKFSSVKGEDQNIAGAWDDASFAVRVRGEAYVKALRDFNQGVREGHGLFAGTFYNPEHRLAGVVLADARYLDELSKLVVVSAQAKYESELRLKAKADLLELLKTMHKSAHAVNSSILSPGLIWPLWKDEKETEIVYGLNPANGVMARYFGRHTREQLLDWAAAGYSYQLD